MIDVYEKYGSAVTAVMRVSDADISKYGVIDADQVEDRVHRLKSIIEKPPRDQAPSNLAAVHAWVLPPRIFPILASTPPGKDGEIWLVDAIATLIKEEPVYALEFVGKRYDAGNKLEYLEASIDFALERPDLRDGLRAHMRRVLDAEPSALPAGS
jgi:UTP--glucose-1-phosphate uridylyltransferase